MRKAFLYLHDLRYAHKRRRFWITVDCMCATANLRVRGCIMCREQVDKLDAMLATPSFMALLNLLRDEPDDLGRIGVIADWLEEHGECYLASQFIAKINQECAV